MEKNKDEVRSFYSSLASSSFFFPVPLWSVFAVFDAWLKMTLTSFFFVLFCYYKQTWCVFFFSSLLFSVIIIVYIFIYRWLFLYQKKKKKNDSRCRWSHFFFLCAFRASSIFLFPFLFPGTLFFFGFTLYLLWKKKKRKSHAFFLNIFFFFFICFPP